MGAKGWAVVVWVGTYTKEKQDIQEQELLLWASVLRAKKAFWKASKMGHAGVGWEGGEGVGRRGVAEGGEGEV